MACPYSTLLGLPILLYLFDLVESELYRLLNDALCSNVAGRLGGNLVSPRGRTRQRITAQKINRITTPSITMPMMNAACMKNGGSVGVAVPPTVTSVVVSAVLVG